jgi:hypothetical protein
MPRIICCRCAVEMRCDKNGVPAVELAEFGPYKIYGTDRWKCPICEYTVLAGFSEDTAEHWEDVFKDELECVRENKDTVEFRIVYTKEEMEFMEKTLSLEVK